MDAGALSKPLAVGTLSTASASSSFTVEVYRSFLKRACKVVGIWAFLSILVAVLALNADVDPQYFLFTSSMASIMGTCMMLFAGYLSGEKHISAFHAIYALAFSDVIFTTKMFLSASMSLGGLSDTWKENHDAWCYFSTILGQVGALSSMGWNAVIILDLLLIVFYPELYGKDGTRDFRRRHILVWGIAFASLIPAVATGSVGLSPDQTCWMLGPYIWAFWGFWYLFVVYAVASIAAMCWKLSVGGKDGNAYRAVQPYVKVVTQLALVTLVFFLNWVWNGALQMMVFFDQGGEQKWLVAVQVFWLGGIGILDTIIWLPFILNALKRFRLIMEYRYTMSAMLGNKESSTPESSASGPPGTSLNDLYALNGSLSQLSHMQQSRALHNNKSPSQDMYSVDIDVDNVIDQLIAEQFSSRELFPAQRNSELSILNGTEVSPEVGQDSAGRKGDDV